MYIYDMNLTRNLILHRFSWILLKTDDKVICIISLEQHTWLSAFRVHVNDFKKSVYNVCIMI